MSAASDLMLAYHQRSDHGRDGTPLDGHACNCRALFDEYEREVLGRGEGERPSPPHPATMIGRK